MPSFEQDELDSDFEFEDEEDGSMQVHDILRSPTVTNITTQTLHCKYLYLAMPAPIVPQLIWLSKL